MSPTVRSREMENDCFPWFRVLSQKMLMVMCTCVVLGKCAYVLVCADEWTGNLVDDLHDLLNLVLAGASQMVTHTGYHAHIHTSA